MHDGFLGHAENVFADLADIEHARGIELLKPKDLFYVFNQLPEKRFAFPELAVGFGQLGGPFENPFFQLLRILAALLQQIEAFPGLFQGQVKEGEIEDRLGQKVRRPGAQSLDDIMHVAGSGNDDDRDFGGFFTDSGQD